VTGKCADIGKTKARFCAGWRHAHRIPQRLGGHAADAVNFYDQRFNLNLTEPQKSDLVAFLNTL